MDEREFKLQIVIMIINRLIITTAIPVTILLAVGLYIY